MSLYIKAENQTYLWNTIHSHPKFIPYLKQYPPEKISAWFRSTIGGFYRQWGENRPITPAELKQLNQNTVTYLYQTIKSLNSAPPSVPQPQQSHPVHQAHHMPQPQQAHPVPQPQQAHPVPQHQQAHPVPQHQQAHPVPQQAHHMPHPQQSHHMPQPQPQHQPQHQHPQSIQSAIQQQTFQSFQQQQQPIHQPPQQQPHPSLPKPLPEFHGQHEFEQRAQEYQRMNSKPIAEPIQGKTDADQRESQDSMERKWMEQQRLREKDIEHFSPPSQVNGPQAINLNLLKPTSTLGPISQSDTENIQMKIREITESKGSQGIQSETKPENKLKMNVQEESEWLIRIKQMEQTQEKMSKQIEDIFKHILSITEKTQGISEPEKITDIDE